MTEVTLRTRILLVDLLKAVAAQLIVWHHLAWYGPLADRAATLAEPLARLDEALAAYGRYAVAIFITTSGFLAAQTLSWRGLTPTAKPLGLIRARYFRLVLPFAAALLLAIAAAALARLWMAHDSIGSPATIGQFLAHLALLHGLLGVESLSAGVWYVAIDFQLYALFVLALWLGQRWSCRLASADFAAALPVVLLALASLFYFNRDARWDDTGLYFFGAYALGIAAGWALRSPWRRAFIGLMVAASLVALWLEFRPRLLLALLTALALSCTRLHMSRVEMRVVHYLGNVSYALFLVHFPVCLVVSAAFERFAPDDPWVAALGVIVAWAASQLVADLFHRLIEKPVLRWQKRRWPSAAPRQRQSFKPLRPA